jgi:hypothetical protein
VHVLGPVVDGYTRSSAGVGGACLAGFFDGFFDGYTSSTVGGGGMSSRVL